MAAIATEIARCFTSQLALECAALRVAAPPVQGAVSRDLVSARGGNRPSAGKGVQAILGSCFGAGSERYPPFFFEVFGFP